MGTELLPPLWTDSYKKVFFFLSLFAQSLNQLKEDEPDFGLEPLE